jgi:hypothetical protein
LGRIAEKVGRFVLVKSREKAHYWVMTTKLASVVMSVAFAASAFAGVGSEVQAEKKDRVAQRTVVTHKACLVFAGSGIPEACDRFAGPIPTTAYPVEIMGKAY